MAKKPAKNKTKNYMERRMQKKLWLAFFGICILFVVLIIRIMYIQYTSGAKYEKQVLSQMSYDSNTIPYKRGDIVDTNGTILATCVDVYALILDPYILNKNSKNIDSTIKAIRRFYPYIEEETIETAVKKNPESRYSILKKNIFYDDMMEFSDFINDKETGKGISGLWFEKSYKRIYPYDSLASDVIGFASAEGNGAIGLESSYNDVLSGVNGRTYGYLDSDSTRERRTEPAQNGDTLVSTIDVNIQSILESEIRSFNERLGGEGGKGSLQTSALLMDPNTGNVLAMADYPNFDLNNPRDLSGLYSEEELELMDEEAKLKAMNNLWKNFGIANTYEPGSTFKPFTIACGLETGALVGDEVFLCNGGEQLSDHWVSCVNRNGHGMETIEKSLMDSCNDALMQMSYRIGYHNFAVYQRLFGFGQRTNIDITGEARTDSVIYSEESLKSTINLATNSFGQNFNTTMIQLATAFSSLINGGTLYEPHLVKNVVDAQGGITNQHSPVALKQTVSKETSDILRSYLGSVVKSGTGKIAGVEGYTMGGKTGTAEKLPRGNNKYLVSFIGFAPVENPQVLIYVVVDEPNVPDQAHSSFAQEIVHAVMSQVLPYMNIEKESVETVEE